MQQHRGEIISGRVERGVIENLELDSCTFDNCSLGGRKHPADRLMVRNVVLRQATQRACFINGATIEDVQLHGLIVAFAQPQPVLV